MTVHHARVIVLAVVQGDAIAQVNLGVMYRDGRAVPQDDAEAARWFRLAADQGNADAQGNLSAMGYNGRWYWYRLVAPAVFSRIFSSRVAAILISIAVLRYILQRLRKGQRTRPG